MRRLALASCLLAGCHLLIAHDPPRDGAAADRPPGVDQPSRDRSFSDGDCPPGRTLCAGLCVDLMTDPGHCGTCAVSCASSECAPGSCEKGQCVSGPTVGPCQGGAGQCVAGSCCTTCVKAGLCVPAASSLTSCGSKGLACEDCTMRPGLPCTTRSCVEGVCREDSTCLPDQACVKGECCACLNLGTCVKGASDALCGRGGSSCEPCAVAVCKTSTCDAATGTCVPGPNVPDGTSCPGGSCVGGSCCQGCAKDGKCLEQDDACGPACNNCNTMSTFTWCQRWRCIKNTCVPGVANDGDYCEVGPAQGACSQGHCCTNNTCFDAMGTALCVNKDTACGPTCVDCTKIGLLCQKGNCS